jgi:hypothetical protein
MSSNYSAEQISKALFEADPMNTCCKENECFDEYDRIAEVIEDRLKEGQRLKQALITEISEWFFDGESFDTNRLDVVLRLLAEQKS